ncbi:hypothetical protein B6D12_06995 [Gilliamella apicola]|uniref:hypothetical protein n=1 Tax=Gilliamella apicola TaxID=1196095 RepID=UPI000A34B0C0|nr:hypothetical protein [Gilliamella apicola]OTP91017.1 hypothetical protein B5S41_01790 [Gilliamella apicola]OTP96399.1 hypothetical protein B6D13_00310 [Gilliamella apicola]OTP97482.1 hypothetical protein B6D05_00795 [Gilliamella apicola]OTQ03638.1 hypothetical protein B6D07_00825 [Gilliamella apicola]OTQ05583.1 hypothetical protein B6D12_06995 [Gilliamella apicola]
METSFLKTISASVNALSKTVLKNRDSLEIDIIANRLISIFPVAIDEQLNQSCNYSIVSTFSYKKLSVNPMLDLTDSFIKINENVIELGIVDNVYLKCNAMKNER